MHGKLSNTFQIVNEKIPATVRSYMPKQQSCLLFLYIKCVKTHHDPPTPIQFTLGEKSLQWRHISCTPDPVFFFKLNFDKLTLKFTCGHIKMYHSALLRIIIPELLRNTAIISSISCAWNRCSEWMDNIIWNVWHDEKILQLSQKSSTNKAIRNNSQNISIWLKVNSFFILLLLASLAVTSYSF